MKETKQQTSTVSEAVRKLRLAHGESQQAFAYRMKTAIRTIARYETIRPPKGKALSEFCRVAVEIGNQDLATVFRDALTAEMGVAGKFTQLGALASYTIPIIHMDLNLLAHNLEYGSGTAKAKVEAAIQKLKEVVAELDKLNIYLPKPTETGTGAEENESTAAC
jgi:transcriptional regulator with XRE-family HTH domain